MHLDSVAEDTGQKTEYVAVVQRYVHCTGKTDMLSLTQKQNGPENSMRKQDDQDHNAASSRAMELRLGTGVNFQDLSEKKNHHMQFVVHSGQRHPTPNVLPTVERVDVVSTTNLARHAHRGDGGPTLPNDCCREFFGAQEFHDMR